jgi:hypothetical protein
VWGYIAGGLGVLEIKADVLQLQLGREARIVAAVQDPVGELVV